MKLFRFGYWVSAGLAFIGLYELLYRSLAETYWIFMLSLLILIIADRKRKKYDEEKTRRPKGNKRTN